MKRLILIMLVSQSWSIPAMYLFSKFVLPTHNTLDSIAIGMVFGILGYLITYNLMKGY
jgi:hypothetical protein